jgi:hypothetical protein
MDEDIEMSDTSSDISITEPENLFWVRFEHPDITRDCLRSALRSILQHQQPTASRFATRQGKEGHFFGFLGYQTAEEQAKSMLQQIEIEQNTITITLNKTISPNPNDWLAKYSVKTFWLPPCDPRELSTTLQAAANLNTPPAVFIEKIIQTRIIHYLHFQTEETARLIEQIGFFRIGNRLVGVTPAKYRENFNSNSNTLVLAPIQKKFLDSDIDRMLKRISPKPVYWKRPKIMGRISAIIFVNFQKKTDPSALISLRQGSNSCYWFKIDGGGYCAQCGLAPEPIHNCRKESEITQIQKKIFRQNNTVITSQQNYTTPDGKSILKLSASVSTSQNLTNDQKKLIAISLPQAAATIIQKNQESNQPIAHSLLTDNVNQQKVTSMLLDAHIAQQNTNQQILATLAKIMQHIGINNEITTEALNLIETEKTLQKHEVKLTEKRPRSINTVSTTQNLQPPAKKECRQSGINKK